MMAGYMDEEAVRKLLYDHQKCSVEGFWEEFEVSNDVESLAMLVERLDFFENPHVGAKIAELLRAPHKNKPRKKGRLYEIDKNHEFTFSVVCSPFSVLRFLNIALDQFKMGGSLTGMKDGLTQPVNHQAFGFK